MALLTTNRKHGKPTLHNGAGYAPDKIGSWVATDERELPWNTIGKALSGSKGKGSKVSKLLTAEEVLKATDLDVTIDMTPVSDPRTGKVIDRLFVTSRTDPKSGEVVYFGPVSDKYKVVQPREALTFFDSVVAEYDGAHYSAAWDMREKSMMGVTIELPEELVVDPQGANDRTGLHLLGVNSYDGSTGLSGGLVATRYFCMNQITPSFAQRTPRSFSLRHSTNVLDRTKDAQALIGVARDYVLALDQAANELYAERMTDAQFHKFLEDFPTFSTTDLPDGIRKARALERRAEAIQAWEAPHNANVRGTRWGALNVVAEFAEWGRNVRGSHRTGADAERQRAIGTLTSSTVTAPVTLALELLAA